MTEKPTDRRADFVHFLALQTRWDDNDVYGHVNNVVYYAYCDTVINRFLIDEAGLDVVADALIGVCVESQCRFLASVSFPDRIEAGLRVGKLGTSSVRYELGIFRVGNDEPCAVGHFVHVFVDRTTRRPMPVPGHLRAALSGLVVP